MLVDSRREAALLRLLNLVAVIPRCMVCVIRRTDELHALAENDVGGEAPLVATSRLYSKYYQVMAGLRQRLRLIVL